MLTQVAKKLDAIRFARMETSTANTRLKMKVSTNYLCFIHSFKCSFCNVPVFLLDYNKMVKRRRKA